MDVGLDAVVVKGCEDKHEKENGGQKSHVAYPFMYQTGAQDSSVHAQVLVVSSV